MKLLGLKSASKGKFDRFFNQLLAILGNSTTSSQAKVKAIGLIRDMIETSKEKNFDLIEDIVNLDIIKVLCDGIKTYSSQPKIALRFIELCVDILEEEERWI